jgi:hypothetical protein
VEAALCAEGSLSADGVLAGSVVVAVAALAD